jgi:hypothetical protein
MTGNAWTAEKNSNEYKKGLVLLKANFTSNDFI